MWRTAPPVHFCKKAVDVCDNLAERQGYLREAAEQRMKLCHQHRGSLAFAGDVAQQEKELPIRRDQVAIVAADGADRCEVIACFPVGGAQAVLRQQVALQLGSQVEVPL